jgi:hypothetical protein
MYHRGGVIAFSSSDLYHRMNLKMKNVSKPQIEKKAQYIQVRRLRSFATNCPFAWLF